MAITSKCNLIHERDDKVSDSDSEKDAKILKLKNVNRRENRPQKYRGEWESILDFKGWLKSVEGKSSRVKCIVCDTEFQADITVLKNHSKEVKHLKNVKKIAENQPKITAMISKRDEIKDQV
ncbi:uncharacterized protein [Leptinotarsa decemlineata]|uniref:uncharacterized protein n=1 Tax=Leptinotarsa decemlineata TaxID=7539 RepID=UPI003D3077A0